MLRLALPVLVEQFLSILVVYSDTILAGRYLEESHLAAMSFLAYLMWMIPSVFAIVAIGSTALIARFVGSGDSEMANRAANQSLLAGVALAIALSVLLLVAGEPLIALMQLEGEAAALSTRYLMFMIPILPGIMLTQIGPACLRGAGDAMWPFLATALTQFGIAIGVSFLAIRYFGAGLQTLWLLMVAAMAWRALLLVWRFLQGRWKRIEI